MAFDFSTLITDRSQGDLDALRDLLNTPISDWTAEQLAEFNQALSKGAYNYTDLNRVTACMEYLDAELRELGYESGYVPVVVHDDLPGVGRLPDGYTELDYIESDGSQYINTGFLPTEKSMVEIKIEPTGGFLSQCSPFGTRNAASPSASLAYDMFITGAKTIRFGYFGASVSKEIENAFSLMEITRDKNQISVNGDKFSNTESAGEATLPLFLFGINNKGNFSYGTPEKLWYCKLYSEEGVIRKDFIPCKNSSGVVGLFDFQTKELYISPNGKTFIPGPVTPIDPIPNPLEKYTWYKEDSPTATQLQRYLSNVSALRSVFARINDAPGIPSSLKNMTAESANNIEKLLAWVESTVTTMRKTLVACGPSICGGDYL